MTEVVLHCPDRLVMRGQLCKCFGGEDLEKARGNIKCNYIIYACARIYPLSGMIVCKISGWHGDEGLRKGLNVCQK